MAMQNHRLPAPAMTLSPELARCITEGTPFPGCRADYAAERAKLLIGGYPNARPHDPEVYAASVALLLASYPADVVRAATDPRDGLQSRHVFPPSLAEIKGALEEEMRPLRRRWNERRQARARLEERPISKEDDQRISDGLKSLAESLRATTARLVAEDAAEQAALREKIAAARKATDQSIS